MMKKTILLILAMCFAFAMPAQASEVDGLSPVESLIGSGSGDVIGPKVADDKVTSARCMVSQLEAADVITNDKITYEMIGGGSSNALALNSQGAMHEVGWQS